MLPTEPHINGDSCEPSFLQLGETFPRLKVCTLPNQGPDAWDRGLYSDRVILPLLDTRELDLSSLVIGLE